MRFALPFTALDSGLAHLRHGHRLPRMLAPGAPLPIHHPALTTPAVWHPEAPRRGPCWVLFRTTLSLAADHPGGEVWISASQRFRLWIDGQQVAAGPSRADREQWGCVPVATGPLTAGDHQIAIEVVHWGEFAGKGQVGGPGFLIVACADDALREMTTAGRNWLCHLDSGRRPAPDLDRSAGNGHRAIGPGEAVDGRRHPWGWHTALHPDWQTPKQLCQQAGNPWGNRPLGCSLVREPLPAMRDEPQAWARIISKTDLSVSDEAAVTIPANQRCRLVLDAGHIVISEPVVRWSGGAGAHLRLTSCEAPIDPATKTKAQRDTIDGMDLPGQGDGINPDGGAQREWRPIWFRSFRYLVVDIETADDPLHLHQIQRRDTGFPLVERIAITVDDPQQRPWQQLRRVSVRTAAACAHETYFDCPAWEQAQFPGDARIQARHHYLLAGDDRLAVKAIRDLAAARVPSGLIRSHAPASFEQVITTYSLQWIGMLDDHRRFRGEPAVVKPYLAEARGILDYLLQQRRDDGLPGLAEAPFIDWADGFVAGCPLQSDTGGSATLACLLADTCQMMAELERFAGWPELALRWQRHARELLDAVTLTCWDAERGLLRDHPDHAQTSVHTQVQATLAGLWSVEQAGEILARALDDADTIQPGTLYYRAHLAEALRRAERTDLVHNLYPIWFGMLDGTGIGTWPESDGTSRSDCHGWGAAPDLELVHSVLGITSLGDGWSELNLAPCLGDLTAISGDVPHPAGTIQIRCERGNDDELVATITSPVPVRVPARGETLPAGTHRIGLPIR